MLVDGLDVVGGVGAVRDVPGTEDNSQALSLPEEGNELLAQVHL